MKSIDEWFAQAEYDIGTAEAMYTTGRYLYTVFMSHLAIEKALKGLYTRKYSIIPPKVHDLRYLSQKCDISYPDKLSVFVESLDQMSILTRYPDELKELLNKFKKEKTFDILNNAKEIIKWLKAKLKE